ncbi:MAG: Crp/Fnr family transcriptional regulator [Ruminococcus sp.]|nr:Crp/Fnr family transcriptional regulator [Ruminococcus sp.]
MKTLHPLTTLNKKEIHELFECIKPAEHIFAKGEEIMRLDEKNNMAGMIVSGKAYLATTTFSGVRTIADHYDPGSFFGKGFSFSTDLDPYIIRAASLCRVYIIEYDKLMHCCEKRCEKHARLIDSLIMSTMHRAQLHIEVLSRRTIRDKLLTFFRQLSKEKDSRTFELPFSLSDLADYISVDRSAMMRELKKLNDEKLIVSHARKVSILKDIVI